MVFHKQPLSLLQPVAIKWKRLSTVRIGNYQWDQLLRELAWTVIIAATKNDRRNAVSIRIGGNQMFRRGLGCRIRTARMQRDSSAKLISFGALP